MLHVLLVYAVAHISKDRSKVIRLASFMIPDLGLLIILGPVFDINFDWCMPYLDMARVNQ